MDDYSVAATWRMPEGGEPLADHVAASDRLIDVLSPHEGAASVGPDGWQAIISVSAPGAVDALTSAVDVLLAAGAEAGMPEWDLVEARTVRADVFDEENSRPKLPDLVGVPELVDVLEVNSRQHARQLALENPRFPAPLYPDNPGPLWDRSAVLEFKNNWVRRPGRPPTP
ncbi:hypothetical protein [Amycolatopsis sp. NPDC004079]|uniref:hypothetical protein n=1 Tax=Amycolatopsis sp. NPDC004079 TaxID=3154549 RepID=UPI0033A02FE4